MDHTTKQQIAQILEGRQFSVCVDLGCGNGSAGETLKPHCKTLIGVDHDPARLAVAKEFGNYDQTILSKAQNYQFPPDTDAVFLFDLIEHLPKNEGQVLLQKITAPTIILTTPSRLFFAFSNGHDPTGQWTRQELEQYGFQVSEYTRPIWSLAYGKHLIAVKTT